MLTALRRYYEKSRKPLAFAMLGLILIAGVLPNIAVQLAASVLLLTIVMHILFEMHSTVTSQNVAWYPSFNDAVPDMTREIRERLHSGTGVKVYWIGVTMEAGWPVIQNLLLDCINSSRGRLDVSLAVVDPEAAGIDAVKWRINATLGSIRHFVDEHGSQISDRNCRLAIRTYTHRPMWHGLLVGEDLLFLSPCYPKNFVFSSPQGSVEVVRARKSALAADRVNYFKAWSEEIDRAKPIVKSGA